MIERKSGLISQEGAQRTFLGGRPHLPKMVAIPRCQLCNSEQTFFFQVTFPENHDWFDLTLSVFFCTACASEDHLIPEMISGPLNGTDIPKAFMADYQKNFSLLVFKASSAEERVDYSPRVRFRPIDFIQHSSEPVFGRVGGEPQWLTEDESPRSCDGNREMCFLMQLSEGFVFDIEESAPPQIELGLDGRPQMSPERGYRLFNSNAIYFFGVKDKYAPLVYVFTQI